MEGIAMWMDGNGSLSPQHTGNAHCLTAEALQDSVVLEHALEYNFLEVFHSLML